MHDVERWASERGREGVNEQARKSRVYINRDIIVVVVALVSGI